jgi:threonylcarbamoyladenosine tRNA methylthiotransferase MtaB
MSTFRLLNFGCRASQADGAALKQQLLQAGLREASTFEESQVAILNTCTVTARADAEVRQFVRRIHRQNPGCRILVTGCYAQRAPEEIAQLDGVAWVVGNSHKHQVINLLERHCGPSQVAAGAVPSAGESAAPSEPGARILVGEIAGEFHFAPAFADDRTRPTLKVQDGCNARCSFCVIPDVRGRSRSLAPEKAIDQVRALEENGYQEVVLSGINLGGYGRDLDRRISFLGLLERLLAETTIPRLRISSLEPMDVSPALIRLVAREPRLAQHFHVPLQSGCDRVLRRMNRRYWASQYAERILAIREQIPHCGIGADVMVGFPGETDEEHGTSVRFIESLPFTYLHIFPYSARPGTPAAASPHQVEGRIARERAQEIRALIASKRQAFLAAQVGQRFSALTLHETKEDGRLALTTHYLNVLLPHSEISPNRLLDVWVGRVHEGMLHGYPDGQGGGRF